MKQTAIGSLTSLAILFTLTGCARPPLNDSPSTIDSVESVGHFVCDGPNTTNCRIANVGILPAQGIHARFIGTYQFPCLMGGQTMPSDIDVVAGTSRHRLVFGESNGVFELDGGDGLTLEDTYPARTRSLHFSSYTGCSLSFAITPVPSSMQIAIWTKESSALVQSINDNVTIYGFRIDVQSWYDVFVQNPSDGVKSVLQQNIVALRATGRELDKIKADSLEQIIKLAPKEQIFAPFEQAKSTLQTQYLVDAAALSATLTHWQQKLDEALAKAIADAHKALGE